MSVITLDTEYLKKDLGLPEDAIYSEVVFTDRWSTHYDIVFKHDGAYYMTGYSEGSTEMQCEYAWDNEETVECIQVEYKEVKIKKWVWV